MIRPRIVAVLYRKDLVDALRESRVLISLLTPIILAVFYNVLFPDQKTLEVDAAYVGPADSALVRLLQQRADSGQTADLKLKRVESADEARRLVETKAADVAFVLPDDVDAAIAAGRSPTVTVIQPEPVTSGGPGFVVGGLQAGVLMIAGRAPPATIATESVRVGSSDQGVMGQMGPRKYFVLATIVMMLGMIAVLAVPIMLTEESEKKTLDALLLVGSYLEVIAAKALVGLTYTALSVAVMLSLTRLRPGDMPTFVAGTALLAIALIGIGLLVGGVFRSAQQVYSWSSVLLIPIIGPAFAVGLPIPDWLDLVFRAVPTSQGMRIMANGLAGKSLFTDVGWSFAVTALWAAAAYALLAWSLARRES